MVEFEVQASVIGPPPDEQRFERSEKKRKIIRIEHMTEDTDVERLAEHIITKVESIDLRSKMPIITMLLEQLQQQMASESDRHVRRRASRRKRREARARAKADASKTKDASQAEELENELREWLKNVNIANLGDYLESLYEDDLRAKARGMGAICKLSQKIGDLQTLADNDQLMSSAARNLKDDFKHSHEVTMGAMGFFERCSRYRSMHALLASKKVGAITLEILAYEIQRFNHRLDKVKALGEPSSGGGGGGGGGFESERRRKREVRHAAAYFAKQDELLVLCVRTLLNLSQQPAVERKMCKRSIVAHLVAVMRRHVELQLGADSAKLRRVLTGDSPRAHLLLATLIFVLKLSLVESCKDDLCAANAVRALVAIVDGTAREEEEIADSSESEKSKKAKRDTGGDLYDGGPIHGPASPTHATPVGIAITAMKALLNVSFGVEIRVQMRQAKLTATLVNRLKSPPFRDLSLRLMYQLSRDNEGMALFASAEDCAPLLLQLVEHYPEPMLPQQLYGLLVNLALHPQNAALLARGAGGESSAGKRGGGRRAGRSSRSSSSDKGSGLRMLVRRAVKTRDPMLVKVLHSLALWTFRVQCDNAVAERKAFAKRAASEVDESDGSDAVATPSSPSAADEVHYLQRGLWAEHVSALVQLTVDSEQPPELLVEAIGLLSCLTPADMPEGVSVASLLLTTSGGGGGRAPRTTLIEKLQGLLRPGFGTADVCLEVVKFFGVVALDIDDEGDDAALQALTSSDIPRLMAELLRAKRDDDDFIAQLLFTFYRWLRVPALVTILIRDLGLPDTLCNFLTHEQPDVRRVAQSSLDLVMLNEEVGELEEGLFDSLRARRFELFNANWLEMMRHENSSEVPRSSRTGGGGGGYGDYGAYDDDELDAENYGDLDGYGRREDDERYLGEYDAVGDSEEEDAAEFSHHEHRDYGERRDWEDEGGY